MGRRARASSGQHHEPRGRRLQPFAAATPVTAGPAHSDSSPSSLGGLSPVEPTGPLASRGLSSEQAAARVAAGKANVGTNPAGRTVAQVLRANVFTRFNAILGSLFVIVLVVGPLQDGLFGIVLVLNTVIGVVQELRARRALDRLTVLNAPVAHAIRDGRAQDLPVDAVVEDDLLELRPGDQIVADGTVLTSGGLEVDESLLSGESLPIEKRPSDAMWSGSVVVAGSGTMEVRTVGDEAFAQRLQGEGRRWSLVRSELQRGTNQILRVITWTMVPIGILLVTSQTLRSGQGFAEAIRGTVAGVGAMVPEGLVLLTTLAFALGALRLARRRVLVQELAAIEGLARVDVLCIDKTGTLTEPGMRLFGVEPLSDAPAREALGAMAASDPTPNATMLAARALAPPSGWDLQAAVPFSAARQWSSMSFSDRGTWLLGAPEAVRVAFSPEGGAQLAQHRAAGRRVLVLAHSNGPVTADALPPRLEAAALVVFEERLRPDAGDTVSYLRAQGVEVKVLSGDNPDTVAAVARRVGIGGTGEPLDARGLPTDAASLALVVERTSVFGRVQPHQKRDIVAALQAGGHVVAMTGDGINDIPALKAADLGMAMGSGSPATRAVAQVVLLDSSFAVVPQILEEGRRVIANVQRVGRPLRDQDRLRCDPRTCHRDHRCPLPLLSPAPHDRELAHHRHPRVLPRPRTGCTESPRRLSPEGAPLHRAGWRHRCPRHPRLVPRGRPCVGCQCRPGTHGCHGHAPRARPRRARPGVPAARPAAGAPGRRHGRSSRARLDGAGKPPPLLPGRAAGRCGHLRPPRRRHRRPVTGAGGAPERPTTPPPQ